MCIGGNDDDERTDSGRRLIGGIINGLIIGSSGMGWIIGNAAGSEWAGSKCISLLAAVSAATQKTANQQSNKCVWSFHGDFGVMWNMA